jgi:predicted ester cyclase
VRSLQTMCVGPPWRPVKSSAAATLYVTSSSPCTGRLFDASPELGGLICDDGAAALEATFVGKHIGEFAGVKATGVEVRLPYSIFYELEAGKIIALRAYFPITSLVEPLRTEGASPTR